MPMNRVVRLAGSLPGGMTGSWKISRLAAAEKRLGLALVKAAIACVQDRAHGEEVPPRQVADAAVAELRRVPCR